MIGEFQIWNTKENRPATPDEINELQCDGNLFLNGYNSPENGIMWPDLNDRITHLIEIREAPKE
jgi:hypothetical protein